MRRNRLRRPKNRENLLRDRRGGAKNRENAVCEALVAVWRLKNDRKWAENGPVSQWLSQQAVAKPDEIFVAACLKRKMAFGESKDKPKHRLRACFLRGARV